MPGIAGKISKFTKSEIDYLFQHARRIVRNQFCTILVAPRQNPEYARILIVLARAVGNAPERNLLRRRIKAIFYEEKLFAGNVDYVVIVYKKMVTLPFDQLRILLVSAASETINK